MNFEEYLRETVHPHQKVLDRAKQEFTHRGSKRAFQEYKDSMRLTFQTKNGKTADLMPYGKDEFQVYENGKRVIDSKKSPDPWFELNQLIWDDKG